MLEKREHAAGRGVAGRLVPARVSSTKKLELRGGQDLAAVVGPGDRGAVLPVLAPHDHLHIKQIRTIPE
jgi:hypothetical protein